jgi:BirA family transcriptional regulator, biotin operon repressor / biotin---[acetyl-CoA-carboxylase] ligase
MKHSSSKIGSQKFIVSDVDSTNNFAAKLIIDGIGGHGSVIMAENQSNGRGQQGSLWQSEPNLNLLCSIVLSSKELSKINPIRINWYVSICIIEFLKRKNINAQIKWPNDILIQENKISGILIENKFVGSSMKNSIIGVGINVNQSAFGGLSATSMKLETNIDYSITDLLDEFIFSLNQNEQLIFREQDDQLKKRYLSSLFGMGEERSFSDVSGRFNGKIIGVDEGGRLIIESNGQVCYFQNKEVKFL